MVNAGTYLVTRMPIPSYFKSAQRSVGSMTEWYGTWSVTEVAGLWRERKRTRQAGRGKVGEKEERCLILLWQHQKRTIFALTWLPLRVANKSPKPSHAKWRQPNVVLVPYTLGWTLFRVISFHSLPRKLMVSANSSRRESLRWRVSPLKHFDEFCDSASPQDSDAKVWHLLWILDWTKQGNWWYVGKNNSLVDRTLTELRVKWAKLYRDSTKCATMQVLLVGFLSKLTKFAKNI
jgi:hypothetical protein